MPKPAYPDFLSGQRHRRKAETGVNIELRVTVVLGVVYRSVVKELHPDAG